MTIRPVALVIAFAALSFSQTLATSASACGVASEPEEIVTQHFQALNAHDRARVLAQWDSKATVTSLGDPTVIESIDHAATRWVQTTKPVTFHVDKIEEGSDKATAHVSVVFEGKKVEDTIVLTPVYGGWKIAGKTSRGRY